jgi:hypothetical protein
MKLEHIKRLKRFIVIGLMLLLTIFSFKHPVVLVHADGASTTEEYWVEFKSTWEGQGADADGENDTEAYTHASKFDASTWDFDVLNIIDVRAYIYNGDDDIDDRPYRIGVWNYTADNNAGTRFGYISFTQNDTIGYEWKGTTGQGPIVVTYNVFFLGVWTDDNANAAQLAYSTSDGSLKSVYDAGFAEDPFAEDGSYSDRTYNIQFRGLGYKNTSTAHNQYYGTATDYTARRDTAYTFPSGSTDRQMRITYPADEGLVNITRSNGALWDTVLTSSEYSESRLNGSHRLITIPHATLNNYEGDYRVFTQSQDYVYTLDGAYYENGTSYGAVNITAYTASNSSSVEVDGETIFGSDEEVLLFVWSLSGGGSRRFYLPDQTETFKVFFPEDTYATYEFSVIDYTGKLGEGTSYLEAYRTVNSTEELIERMRIQDTFNVVPLTLVVGQVYHLEILWNDGTTYDWGYFVAGIDPTPTIVISDLTFSQQAQLSYKFVNIEATRPNSTHIQVNYEDTAPATYGTDWCNITVAFRNGTYVTGYNSQAETLSWDWYSANNLSDYWVVVEIDHGFFGLLDYSELLDYDRTYNSFPDLGILGTFGGINTANLTSLILVLGVFGGFSRYSAGLALILAFSLAGTLRLIGANTWDYNVLALGLALSIGFTIYQGRVRP